MSESNKNKIVLKNSNIIEFNNLLKIKNCDILIENGIISKIGKLNENDYNNKTVDLKGKLITPGLVCSHNHIYSVFSKGITNNLGEMANFLSILNNLWWKLDRALDEETLYYSALIGAIEALKCGTTTIVDHNASPNFISNSLKTIEKAFLKVGIRGILSYEVTDRNGEEGLIEGVEENLSFANYIKKKKRENPNYLIESAIGAHASFTLNDRALQLLSMAVDRSGRGIHIHIAEDKYDVSHSLKIYKKTPVERLYDFGILDKKSLLVHCVHLKENDFNLINKSDCFVIHNPRSNMNNSIGHFQFFNKLNCVALGTDGIGSNMIEELKFAFFKSKESKLKIDNIKLLNLLNNSNLILKRYFKKNFGNVEEGAVADLTVFDNKLSTPLVDGNLLYHLIFGNFELNVDSVIVNGEFVLNNGKFPFNVDEIYKKGRELAQKLWNKMDKLDK